MKTVYLNQFEGIDELDKFRNAEMCIRDSILNDKYYSSEELSKELKSANQKSYNKLKQEYNTLLEEYHKLTEDYENYKKEHENRN